MCNTKPCNNCCHEEDLLCCMPIKHCCGGYSEHNNCCPHDRCCCSSCCGGCGKCCDCDCCYCKYYKLLNKLKDQLAEDEQKITELQGNDNRIENKVENYKTFLLSRIVNLEDGLEREINERILDVDAEEIRAKERENQIAADSFANASFVWDAQGARIVFKNKDGITLCTVDASAFVKDGMVDTVQLIDYQGDKALKVIFNTDAGKSDVIIPIGDLFELDDYYTKNEIDGKVNTINNNINTEINRAKGAEQSLQTQINTINNTTIPGLQSTINQMIQNISNAQTAITNLQSAMSTAQTNITNLQADSLWHLVDGKVQTKSSRAAVANAFYDAAA